jgi:hypothetical protein
MVYLFQHATSTIGQTNLYYLQSTFLMNQPINNCSLPHWNVSTDSNSVGFTDNHVFFCAMEHPSKGQVWQYLTLADNPFPIKVSGFMGQLLLPQA